MKIIEVLNGDNKRFFGGELIRKTHGRARRGGLHRTGGSVWLVRWYDFHGGHPTITFPT
ncbi:hypothetical protein [Paraburkholderia caffeinitolerans]|uniref:hypothetical protein n=1 Tax=Paraburkholderia caffeinitolerans TaxID=1723730 RepID=UPI001583E9DA|nr:hypothetical protein [Paraburkholderia caffeinitolerans]